MPTTKDVKQAGEEGAILLEKRFSQTRYKPGPEHLTHGFHRE